METVDDIISQLESISDSLNDCAMSLLAEAIREGHSERPPMEKKISQARRAVEKALQHLRQG
jgi:DNA-binding FrmR family transcriptional regulator